MEIEGILDRDGRPSRSVVRLFVYGVCLVLVCDAFHLFQFPLTIDGEVAAFTLQPENYIQNERWALYGLTLLLLPHPIIPVVPDLIAAAALAAAYAVTSLDWDRRVGPSHYAAAPVALMFPIFAEIFLFPDLSYALFIGVALAAVASAMGGQRTLLGFGASVVLLTVAVGVYQPVALYPVAATTVKAALDLERRGTRATALTLALRYAAIVLAVLISHAIGRTLVTRLGLTSGYIESSTDLALVFDDPAGVLSLTFSNAAKILAGAYEPIYVERSPAIAVLLAAALAGLTLGGRIDAGLILRVSARLALVAGVIAMAAVPVIDGGVLPNRTLLGLPIAAAGLVFAGARTPRRPTRLLIYAAALACAVQFAAIQSRVHYAAVVTWLNDRSLGQEVLGRIAALPDLPSRRPLPVEIVGHHEWPPSPMTPAVENSMVGSSFFAWDEGSVGRILRFFRSLGAGPAEFTPASKEQHGRVAAEAAAMPTWPNVGSVRVIDGTVVVKFSSYSEFQL